jgi:hypothetical protein
MDPFITEEGHDAVTSASTTPPGSSNNIVLGALVQGLPALESVIKEETQDGVTGTCFIPQPHY